jgi:hypothetical protein
MRPREFIIFVLIFEVSNFEITLTTRAFLNSFVRMGGLHARHDLLALLSVPDMSKHTHKFSTFPNQRWRPRFIWPIVSNTIVISELKLKPNAVIHSNATSLFLTFINFR